MPAIRITAGPVSVRAILLETATGEAIRAALPIRARASTWGDEIYFAIPVDADEEDARAIVDVGDLAYWPPGSAFCIFFGPTPASHGDEVRPASPVNLVGRVESDATVFRQVRDGAPVLIELLEDDPGHA